MSELHSRNLALDVFRGMTVCFMIIVNTPGSWGAIYSPLQHADWHGFTPTDLVFPSFLFAVGNAMAFVMYKFEQQSHSVFWRKILKRTIIIFGIGFLMNWFPFVEQNAEGEWVMQSLSKQRIPGVLQRIALCYFFASIVIHYGSKKFAVWFSVFALLVYWFVMYAFGEAQDPYSLTGHIGLQIDLWLMGPNHLYKGEGIPFDPEGLLSTLPAVVNVIWGYFVGDYIRRNRSSYEVIAKLMLVGAVLIFGAFVWDLYFPINKKIWTSSYVLLTVGIDVMILSVLIYVIDMYNRRDWTYFFVVFGRNPLFIYMMAGLIVQFMWMIPVGDKNLQSWLYKNVFGSFAAPVHASFLFAISYMLFNWLIGLALDKRKIYIRV
jgi:predicted acyltransferase